jgi:triosephosphate isomerase (TIM)
MKKKISPLLVANWKMTPSSFKEVEQRIVPLKKSITKFPSLQIGVSVPHFFLSQTTAKFLGTKKQKGSLLFGAQDVSVYESGSKTGEVSSAMIQSTGACFVIVGHSERRALGETNEVVAQKIKRVVEQKLTPILCVGEDVRDDNGNYLEAIKNQIKESLVYIKATEASQIVIAYEPVWVIGRKDNVALSAHDIHQMVLYIRKFLIEIWNGEAAEKVRILYGGSVTKENAQDIVWNGEVEGLLIGRASFEPLSFIEIWKAVSQPLMKIVLKKSSAKKDINKKGALSQISQISQKDSAKKLIKKAIKGVALKKLKSK